jgi:hypothetical protein
MLQRTIPIAILSISGIVLVLAYFSPFTQSWGEQAVDWFNIIAGIAYILGGGNLLRVNLEKISAQRPGWAYAAITVAAFVAMLGFGLLKLGAVPSEKYPDVHFAGDYESNSAPYGWMYWNVISPLGATMFAMLAFYVASAAFRAFRAKNLESVLLLGTAFIVLLSATAAGAYLTGWIPADSAVGFMRAERLRTMITEVVQTAGMRAIGIGIAIGVVALSVRLILGIDRSYLSKDGGAA